MKQEHGRFIAPFAPLREQTKKIIKDMNALKTFTRWLRSIANVYSEVDTEQAALRIRDNIWFRGSNVWILAFSIVIASVGLNVNSTAVIIGAMLISPLMGPIMGAGLALGTNDIDLLKDASRNLLVMVTISLLTSFMYFLISPLDLVNPTEIMARTRPTLYDVLIALFGGMAGILESSRKEKGTVLSGVAIATALMPPICTAGYGLANANWGYFFGALSLFLINCVFIIVATYIFVEILHFKEVVIPDAATAKKNRRWVTVITVAVIIPSVWSAILVIKDNNFEKNVQSFIAANKSFSQGYIYDYHIASSKGKKTAEIFVAGEKLSDETIDRLTSSAAEHGIKKEQLEFKESTFSTGAAEVPEKLLKGVYERTDAEISRMQDRIIALQSEIDSYKNYEIPYEKITRELKFKYPELTDVAIGRGASVDTDSLSVANRIIVIATSEKKMKKTQVQEMQEWLKIRLEDENIVVYDRQMD